MKTIKVFEVYDSNGKYQGFFLGGEENLAKAYAETYGGYYVESSRVVG